MKVKNLNKVALEFGINLSSCFRFGKYYTGLQYMHLLRAVIEILDFLYEDYDVRRNIVFNVNDDLKMDFYKIKAAILTIEKVEGLRSFTNFQISKMIESLEQDPDYIFENWKETRDIHIKTADGWEQHPQIKKYKIDPYIDSIIKSSRKELSKLKSAKIQLQKQINNYQESMLYELKFDYDVVTIKTPNLEYFVVAKYNNESNNQWICEFLEKAESNSQISRKDLEEYIGIQIKTPVTNLLNNLGFSKEIKDTFFLVNEKSNSFIIRKIMTIDEIKRKGVNIERLNLQINRLNKV